MTVYIKNGTVYYKHYSESITVERLNIGLSEFYRKDVKVHESNLSDFEGDIVALCFGFN
jgi:hypothetical protein